MIETLKLLCEQKNYRELKKLLSGMPEVDIAEFISKIENESSLIIFRLLDKDTAADVFAELDVETQQFIINAFSDKEIELLINDLYVDDAVDLIEDLPASVVRRVLKNAGRDTREVINRLLKYESDSVGSIMTTEYAELKAGTTVSAAIETIKTTGIDLETVYICYVTGAAHLLLGVVSFKDMLFANDGDKIGDIMSEDVKFLRTTDDREQAASMMSKYDFLAMPVVDPENRLVGIVTIDDTLDVIEQEASEDFHKMSAMLPSETPYLRTPVLAMCKSRFGWLLALMLSGIVSGVVMSSFEEAIAVLPLLVAFMPMITGTGGNAGSQSSTTVIRAMALGEITKKDGIKVIFKEAGAALMAGCALAAVNFLRIIIMYSGTPGLMSMALVISLCLVLVVLMSNLLGATLPMLAQRLKLDPAIMAGPLITSTVDVLGLLVYFSVASTLLLNH